MTLEEISAGRELPGKPFQKPNLCGTVKVDDHVAAEDNFRPLGQTVVGIHEIEPPKLDFGAELRHHTDQIRKRIAAAHEVFFVKYLGHGLNGLSLENAQAGLRQYFGAD